ncbi:Electron transfer flavoprotein, alpha subunit (plasmid) [Cupriavidus necator H850]|uniref:electron transfer flavoprotein subunit alpha/FixB family protein n=1 Tax=Cupriavidus necator TaxID=106590 RepID=UPI00129E8B3D|nr:electron transfer flavoprotein subunit alpha/FixB family protein [Cupriavidus necator]KAI3602687.1 Electron transfer flavoprotein, alpha subunit [Cupriavidus necator H850]
MNVLILAAHDGQHIDPTTAHIVGAASRLASGGAVHLLVLGHRCATVADQAAGLPGVAQVLLVDDAAYATPNAETIARQLAALGRDYQWLVAAHDLRARAALPRTAALLEAAYLSDVIGVDADSLRRPIYAGAAISHLQSTARTTCLTLRTSAFAPVRDSAAADAVIVQIPAVPADTRTQLVGRDVATSHRPDLGRARIVVAGGRGVGSAASMALVEKLADHLGAAVGASRAAVDAGFAANAVQVGQTGKTVAPDVYIALGISGAIQHLAGIKDAKCIVAINKDPDAPIFQVADLGFVGDLFEALPALQAGLPTAN